MEDVEDSTSDYMLLIMDNMQMFFSFSILTSDSFGQNSPYQTIAISESSSPLAESE